MEQKQPSPPQGLSRLFFRLPIWLYRLGLGGILGGRFLLINHIGRKSGQPRQAVVEVVRHDAVTDVYIVCSGFGENAQWFQNLMHMPDVIIQAGRRSLSVRAERLPAEVGGDEMVDYARRHPKSAAELAKFMGFTVDASDTGYRAIGEQLPFVAFHPRG